MPEWLKNDRPLTSRSVVSKLCKRICIQTVGAVIRASMEMIARAFRLGDDAPQVCLPLTTRDTNAHARLGPKTGLGTAQF